MTADRSTHNTMCLPGMPSVSQHATNISTPDAAYAVLTKAKPSTLYYRLMPHPVMVSSFSGGEVQGENGNLERAGVFCCCFFAFVVYFLGKKAPLLGATLGKVRPKQAPLRIRSSQKRPFWYMHFPAKKPIRFVVVWNLISQ